MVLWKDIKNFEGFYHVNNEGTIKGIERERMNKNGSISKVKEKVLSFKIDKDGYCNVGLCKNGKLKTYRVHRLVAEAFIPNYNNLPCVNHKDENKTNNFVWINEDGSIDESKSNLEWCSVKYNNNYGTKNIRTGNKLKNRKSCKPVLQYDLDGNMIKEWKSLREIQRILGYIHNYISDCCKGKYETAYDYKWKFKEPV